MDVKKNILIFVLFTGLTAHALDCKDTKKVAAEAVATSLLGSWMPFATHSCFKGVKYKYFRPELGTPTGEILDSSKLIWFDKTKDKYTIEAIEPEGKSFNIRVKFTIGGKIIKTTYVYDPQPDYAKRNRICGHVVNYQHGIFRKDCLAPGRLKL